jgi:2-methylcitrate dehydratase PrpD
MTATNDAATKTPTRALATFISTSTSQPALLTPELRSKAKELLIDYIGVVVGGLATADSSEPIYAAVRAMQGTGNAGHCTVIGKGDAHMLPQYAALVNSAFGHSLDFDDTYAAGVWRAARPPDGR